MSTPFISVFPTEDGFCNPAKLPWWPGPSHIPRCDDGCCGFSRSWSRPDAALPVGVAGEPANAPVVCGGRRGVSEVGATVGQAAQGPALEPVPLCT